MFMSAPAQFLILILISHAFSCPTWLYSECSYEHSKILQMFLDIVSDYFCFMKSYFQWNGICMNSFKSYYEDYSLLWCTKLFCLCFVMVWEGIF